jgi:hypothetical protein
MGFGKKTDYKTGRTLDLDASYKNMIKPAVEDAGLTCIRADEIVHSGVIDKPMFEELLNADVVVADLSTANANAFYELGVRHALRPRTTITIAETGLEYPFDVNFVVIRRYKHLGEDIGGSEIQRFRGELRDAIQAALDQPKDDSPVYTFLSLQPPQASPARSRVPDALESPVDQLAQVETIAALMQQSEEAIRRQDWDEARSLLQKVRSSKQLNRGDSKDSSEDPYVLQRLALATYRSRKPTQQQAIEDAREVLLVVKPETLNDPEVLSIWGEIHQRRWELVADQKALDIAITAYQKAFHLRRSYQDGIRLAFLLNTRAAVSEAAEGIADFVSAQRVRREVTEICERALKSPERGGAFDQYSVRAALAEAWFGLGEDLKYEEELGRANQTAPHPSLSDATQDRVAQLGILLDFSPLAFLAAA